MIRSGAELRTAMAGGALLLLALTGCSDSEPASIPEPPAQGNVLDLAEVLTPAEEQEISSLIDERNASTDAARVAVLLVEDADGSIEDYARDVATSWGVGDDGADNGVLILADTGERELRVETADGVREQFSDGDAEDVVTDVLEPAFADEEYAEGLIEAVDQVYLYAEGGEPVPEPVDWVLFGSVAGVSTVVVGGIIGWVVAVSRRRRREADEEIRAAEQADPQLRLTEQQRNAYRSYRYGHRGDDAITNPAIWLPLYIANPALYSGGGGSGASGSSYNGGGGFTGGGASGSY
ncbi:TPM domain-containing protein [Arthrobacter echini]|uniref:TPM domain-containing protein n=1 Tax=Arthrobacter echini TaxID=1529066 RepID=A0A4S5EA92_9MICC|nr:TPM domain-containing protein [Arthrobacter echini]THJ68645.1 TPM domain-containing protein [Arthrobacter echini]